jgi:diphthamide synthase (EF-2-diphthine--ammonia ligase)
MSGVASSARPPLSVATLSGRFLDLRIPVVFSWSAGKDSAFGLWTLLQDPAYEVRGLLTTVTEGYDRVSMSGAREELLDRQADALVLPVIKVRIPPVCPNEVYEQRMASTLAAETFLGIDHVAFADLFLEDVRAYREERLGWAGKHGVFPLWGRDTSELAREMVASGFRAVGGVRRSPNPRSLLCREGLRFGVPGRPPRWGRPLRGERGVPHVRLGRPHVPGADPVPNRRSRDP